MPINNIQYADDMVLLANAKDEMQQLINAVSEKCNEYGIKLNTRKTKYMVVHKKHTEEGTILMSNSQFRKSKKNYLSGMPVKF